VPAIFGPKVKIEVITLGNNGTISSQVLPKYIPTKPIPVLDVKFALGSASISKREIRKLENFITLINEQVFTKVSITAFTDGVGGISGAKALSSARAKAVSKYLDRYLDVVLFPTAKGISPTALGSKPDVISKKAEIDVQ
jgi:hypothetical protein